jgi:signal peptidase I
MPHRAHVRPEEDDEPEEEEDEEEEEEPAPRRHTRSSSRRGSRRPHPPPVRRWRGPGSDEEEEEEPSFSGTAPSGKKPIYWRARDSLFFEPLLALAIIVVLLVSLFAYTQNWPPIYVVESSSMQHGSSDQLGLINTGDLVLAQKTSASAVTPYVSGVQTGYSTYGEFGDVILYWPNGQGSTPIIHRAILYLQWDPKGLYYNATDLAGLPCGTQPNAVYSYVPAHGPPNCNTTRLSNELDLYNIGWMSVNISLDLNPTTSTLGAHSGFLTMGDRNPTPDQPGLSSLVEPGWVIGVARGMIPWFGAVKLLLQGQAGEVPPQSWQFLGLTIVGLILVAFGIHYALRTEGIETPLRREEEEAARAAAESEPEESAPRGWFSRLRHRSTEDEDEDEEEPPHRRRTRPPPSSTPSRRGRPVPHVRRAHKPQKKSDSDDEL